MSACARQRLVSIGKLFSQDMLGDNLKEWLQESALMTRTFRQNAIVSGLTERNFPGKEKTGRPRVKGRVLHKDLDRISPLAVPTMLEARREPVHGEGREAILAKAKAELVSEVIGG